jgi:multiple sugar transport system substrate-binding protein
MKKVLSTIFVVLCLSGVLFAGGKVEQAAPSGAPINFSVISHRVHNTVITTGPGGDMLAEWKQANNIQDVEWITLGNDDIHAKLFMEASLPATDIGVAFVLNTYLTPDTMNLFEPLTSFMASKPVEDLEDISPGLRDAATSDGVLYGIPFRHATSSLHYNEAILKERGFDGPPTTIEEMIDMIPQLTYKQADGTQVYGFVLPGKGQLHANFVDLARAWDGDYITGDFKVKANETGMVNALSLMNRLFKNGMFPSNFTAIENNDLNTWMQQGRVAMTFSSTGRTVFYNDATQSKYPGSFKTVPIPISESLKDKYEVAPAKTEFWCMMIPKNSRYKDLAWDFIVKISSKDSTLRAALNGNGPTRSSTYLDKAYQDKVSYWETEQKVLKVARVPLPGFKDAQKAADLYSEYSQMAIIGVKPVQEAMDELVKLVTPLLP